MLDGTTDTSSPNMAARGWRRLLLNRWIIAGVGVVSLYALLGFLLAPRLFKRYVSNYAIEKLKRKASIVEVRVNPFLFTFDATLHLKRRTRGPLWGSDACS